MANSEYDDGSVGKPTKSRSKSKQMHQAWVRMHGSNEQRKEYNAARAIGQRELTKEICCRFCRHGFYEHAMYQEQPYVFHGQNMAERRTLTKYVEIIDLQCLACAKEKGTTLVQCYTETIGVGENIPTPDQSAAQSGRH